MTAAPLPDQMPDLLVVAVDTAAAAINVADRLDNLVTGERIMDGEPAAEQAATLVGQLMDAGAVARLDLVHGALLAAFRAGREAERAEVQRLAQQHAAAFAAAVTRRADEQAARAARPWNLQ